MKKNFLCLSCVGHNIDTYWAKISTRENNRLNCLLYCSFSLVNWIETQDANEWETYGPPFKCEYYISEQLLLLLTLSHPNDIEFN